MFFSLCVLSLCCWIYFSIEESIDHAKVGGSTPKRRVLSTTNQYLSKTMPQEINTGLSKVWLSEERCFILIMTIHNIAWKADRNRIIFLYSRRNHQYCLVPLLVLNQHAIPTCVVRTPKGYRLISVLLKSNNSWFIVSTRLFHRKVTSSLLINLRRWRIWIDSYQCNDLLFTSFSATD